MGLALLSESRLPPHSTEAEQAVLGAILFDSESFILIADLLQPEDFYRGPHQYVYQAMLELFKLNEPVDVVTVSEYLNDKEALEAAGGRSYVMDLAMGVATAANAHYYAKIIKGKALMRGLITAGCHISELGYGETETSKALEIAQQEIFRLSQGQRQESASVMDILPTAYEQILERHKNRGSLMGVGSGFYDLDNYTAGFQKSDLIILAARPSMGKTAFCLNMTHVALREEKPVMFFSLEMSKQQLVLRMLCAEAEVDAQRIRTGNLSELDFTRIKKGLETIWDAPIHIDDSPGLSVMEMRARARQLQMKLGQPLGLVVVDYLQLMEGPGSGDNGNRNQEISSISRGLKGLARELKVPVIALSQLSRAVESRQDKKPMLSDLRESGSIEQDADLVMFIYRDEYYNKDSERPGTADIIIAKQRNGPVGDVTLLFRHSITRFMNPADREVRLF